MGHFTRMVFQVTKINLANKFETNNDASLLEEDEEEAEEEEEEEKE